MSSKNKILIEKETIVNAINKTDTMGGAAKYLKIDWRTFKLLAQEYGVYKPTIRNGFGTKFELTDILNGKHPQYPTSKLSKRLVKEGYKNYECESCGIKDWNGSTISLELNHKDGNNDNHKLENLELLCPNCHSQTPTYRSKKIKYVKRKSNL